MNVINMLQSTLIFVLLFAASGCTSRVAETSIEIPALTTVSAASTSSGVTDTPIQEPNKCSEIVFSGRNAVSTNADLYSICRDGSNFTQLTNTAANEVEPAWSPDGSRLVYASDVSGKFQLYLLSVDSGITELLTFEHQNNLPKWIPGQQKIAVRSTDGQGLWWWSVVDLAGKTVTKMTEPSYDFFFQTPAWSPDGKKMLTMSLVEQSARNDGSSQIHISNADGSDDHALTANIWANISPAWSPDGQIIAFLSEMHGSYNQFALYSMALDGSDQQQVSKPIFPETTRFCFSPDGSVVVIDNAPDMGKIAVIDLQSGNMTALMLPEGYQAFQPACKPQ